MTIQCNDRTFNMNEFTRAWSSSLFGYSQLPVYQASHGSIFMIHDVRDCSYVLQEGLDRIADQYDEAFRDLAEL